MFNRWLYLLFFLIQFSLFAQKSTPPGGTTPANTENPPEQTAPVTTDGSDIKYNLEYFDFKDLNYNMYTVSIMTNKPHRVIEELNRTTRDTEKENENDNKEQSKGDDKQYKRLRVQVGDIRADIFRESAEKDEDNANLVNFTIVSYNKIPAGKTTIKLFSQKGDSPEVLESSLDFDVPPLNDQPGKQPFISAITPEGGTRGATITIKGKNFGDDIDVINVVLFEKTTNPKDNTETYKDMVEKKPFYLSPIINEEQEIKINIPLRRDLMGTNKIRKELKLQVFVQGRPSNFVGLTLLPDYWQTAAGLVGVFIVILFMIAIYMILKGAIKKAQEKESTPYRAKNGTLIKGVKRPSIVHFFEIILTDKTTNSYSLSRFQAFFWTIASVGSYIYVAFSQGLLLRNGKIPDFNPSLVVLMSISYGGLLAANTMGAKKPKNEIRVKPPELSNLFCEGGSVDLTRLQLFAFTIVGILVYFFNLAYGNPLEGLPDLPPTLLGLMGVSQTGYIGGKALGDKLSINSVVPNKIKINDTPTISLVGSGFASGTKVLFDGLQPIETIFKSASEMTFTMPAIDHATKVSFSILTPSGSPVLVPVDLEIYEGETPPPSEVPSTAEEIAAADEEITEDGVT